MVIDARSTDPATKSPGERRGDQWLIVSGRSYHTGVQRKRRETMPEITQIGRVMVPVADQDAAIAFYRDVLGFSLSADMPFGDGDRWVEVAPPRGGAAIALVPPQGEYQPGRMTGIALESADARADHVDLRARGVDVDEQIMGGDGVVPPLFFFRDGDGNQLMIVQGPSS
jgi:catechol 2,3-dioxygenase-like lactoylglutathione lyase family enzyme